MQEAYRTAYRALFIGLGIVIVNAAVIYLLGKPVLGLFTKDETIVALGVSLLGLNILLQPGKMLNMAIQNALNAVGDTRFTMWISLGSLIGGQTMLLGGLDATLTVAAAISILGWIVCPARYPPPGTVTRHAPSPPLEPHRCEPPSRPPGAG